MYTGNAIQLNKLSDGLTEIVFDFPNSSVNKLNTETLDELEQVLTRLEGEESISGLLLRSEKSTFIVGGDVTEFFDIFASGQSTVEGWAMRVNSLLDRIESLPFPTIAAINNLAVGGGLELSLSCDYRVTNQAGKVALPEVKLGLCPGWGGTVRLSRLTDLETSMSMMLSGKFIGSKQAKDDGIVDFITDEDQLLHTAKKILLKGTELDYLSRREQKRTVEKNSDEVAARMTRAREKHSSLLNENYPATVGIFAAVSDHIFLPFNDALRIEAETFGELSQTQVATSLLTIFFNEQLIKKKTKAWVKKAEAISNSAVLGAGIMGGGIVYQSAVSGVPARMKDISQAALDLGMLTANKLFDRLVSKNKLDARGKEDVLNKITTTLDYNGFDKVDLIVEAVVENAEIKANVLQEVEAVSSPSAVLTSNTSTISIDTLAKGLQRPEQFCGMHFFNPVSQMPLVEVIRGRATNDATIAKTVAYAHAMGKTPIVVKDCPGFLVNRILFPYFNGFNRLLQDGVSYERIDEVMESFGWPMGPAYLADVIGLDTMVHADKVLQLGFPERMQHESGNMIEDLLAKGALGQKNNQGFYDYGTDENGRRTKIPSEVATSLRGGGNFVDNTAIDDQDIIDRMMIPLCTESIRCLEDGIVETVAEVDMGLLLGLGFPRFRGGALRYIDSLGLQAFEALLEKYSLHGGLYQAPESFKARVLEGANFY